jgi:phage terminase small subunit
MAARRTPLKSSSARRGRAKHGDMRRRIARFVARYIVRYDAVEAALACGYSARSAKQRGAQVLHDLARIARFDVRRLYDPDTGELRAVAALDDDTATAVASVKHTTRGSGERQEHSVEVKLWDKLQALIAYGRHLGLFELDNRQRAASNTLTAILASLDRGKAELRFPAAPEQPRALPRKPHGDPQPEPLTGLRLLDRLGKT